MKKINFDLAIATNALVCPNPTEWYAKSYLTSDIVDNYRVIPGVKNSIKVSTATFSPILVAETCDFSATAAALSSTTLSIFPLQAQTQICKKDIETSYVSLEMAKGSANYTVEGFMSHYWEEMSNEINEEIEYIRWQGSTTNGAYSGATAFKKLCNGYEAILLADAGVVDVTLTAVTTANVISILGTVLANLHAAVKAKRSDLRFYVSPNVFTAFQIAAAAGNNSTYITEALGANFVGIKIVEAMGLSANKIVLTSKNNLIYLLDGEGDATDLKAIDLSETTGQPLLRTAAWLKIGFAVLNSTEIVYFN